MNEPLTPEHDKFRPYQEDAQIIGDFLEWLSSQGVHKVKWGVETWDEPCRLSSFNLIDNSIRCRGGWLYAWKKWWLDDHEPGESLGKPCDNCNGTGYESHSRENWIPDGRSIQQLIADFYGIDKKKFDEETEEVYQYISRMAK